MLSRFFKEMIKANVGAAKSLLKDSRFFGSLIIRLWKLKYCKARKRIMDGYEAGVFYLNVGGGEFLRSNWRVLDYVSDHYQYEQSLIDYNVNLFDRGKWSIPEASVDLVYSSHCFEHIDDDSALVAFSEIYRILKKGGIFRLTTPDIDLAYSAYGRGDMDFFKDYDMPTLQERFMTFFCPCLEVDIDYTQMEKDYNVMEKVDFLNKYTSFKIDLENHHFGAHISWWNSEKVRRMAVRSGFDVNNVMLSGYRQSITSEMRNAEFDITNPHLSLYVEMVK